MPEDWERGIAVVAHPDDLEYGAASAIARWTRQGKDLSYLLVTSGESGIDGLSPERCAPLREAEERNGAALVGVHNVEFLGFPDGLVEYGIELRRAIAAAIRRLQPQFVLTMNFDLTWGPGGSINHADHRAVGLATIDAVRDAANRWLFTEDGEPWSGVRATYVFATPEPTHYVDVSDTIDVAVASLQAHRGYLEGLGGEFDAGAFLRTNAESAATDLPCRYAVSLQAVS